jgi:hypothetical protein
MIDWSGERVAKLTLEDIKALRTNAVRKGADGVVALRDAEIEARMPRKSATTAVGLPKSDRFVCGYHFVCPRERGVLPNDDGTLWSGTWVVDKSNVETSIKYGAYIALHVEKSEPSYIQGKLKGWRRSERDRQYSDEHLVQIPMGIDFLLGPTTVPYAWIGDGSGEKGYAWKEITGTAPQEDGS